MRKVLCVLLILSVTLSVFAAGSKEASNQAEPAGEFKGLITKTTISLAANPIGQSSYQQAAQISEIINSSGSNLTVVAEATNGYAENVGLVAQGDVEIAFTNNLMLSDGYYAKGDYSGLEPEKCLGVISLSCNKTHVIVLKNSPINAVSYEMFKGKKIGIGQVGGTSRFDALALMAALGLKPGDYTGVEVKGAEQTEMMKNGQLDVFIWNGKAPIATVLDLLASKDCVFLDIPSAIIKKIIENSNGAYTEQVLDKSYYDHLDRDIKTFGNNAVLFANADVPEAVVYEFIKRFYENLDALKNVNKGFKEIVPEKMLEGISVPLHKGALRYYNEIGLPGIAAFN